MAQTRDIVRPIQDASPQSRTAISVVLWIIQILLAALFLFAGVMKLVLSSEVLATPQPNQIQLPVLFLRFIGVCEVLGALGLILPGLLRIKAGLTPLAAAGLLIIMIGAVVISISGGIGMAAPAFVCLLLLAFVAYGRWRLAPHRSR